MSPVDHVRPLQLLPDEEVERYLRSERIHRQLRLLWVGLVFVVLGAAGSYWVWRWLTGGGVMLLVALAAPFAVLAGVPITLYALIGLLQALRKAT